MLRVRVSPLALVEATQKPCKGVRDVLFGGFELGGFNDVPGTASVPVVEHEVCK
jgi:hypothetical protein